MLPAGEARETRNQDPWKLIEDLVGHYRCEMDLSFPSTMAMGMVAFILTYNATTSVAVAFLAALVTGTLIGWFNGLIIVKFGIPSLVATIGTQFFWRGAVLVLALFVEPVLRG